MAVRIVALRVASEGRRQDRRRRHGAGGKVRLAAGMNGEGFELHGSGTGELGDAKATALRAAGSVVDRRPAKIVCIQIVLACGAYLQLHSGAVTQEALACGPTAIPGLHCAD